MNYEKLSDFEINKAVAINRGGYQGHVEHMEHGVKESNRDSHGIFYFERDYCNNPSDAWPIIKSNHINIGWAGDEEWFARTVHTAKVFDANPLRAAMIVYLMIKDEEQ